MAVLFPQKAIGKVCLQVSGAVPGTKYYFSDINERLSLKHSAIGHIEPLLKGLAA